MLVNVHAKSRLIPETSAGTPVRRQGPGGSLPGKARAIPCTVRAVTEISVLPSATDSNRDSNGSDQRQATAIGDSA